LLKKTFILLILLTHCCYLSAQYFYNDNCKDAYKEIINLNFSRAQFLLNKEQNENPQNLIRVYLENYIDFLKLIISEDKQSYIALKPNKDSRIALLEKGNKNSPYYRYCLAEVYLHWAAIRIKFNEYIGGAYEINKAYKILKRNHEQFPSFVPTLKSLGLINSILGSVPDNYKWIMKIIGYDATIEQGITQLGIALKAATQNKEFDFLQAETVFILAYVNINLSNDEAHFKQLIRFVENNKNIQELSQTSALINYALANMYLRSKLNNDKAIQILSNFNEYPNCLPFHYRTFALGMAKLNRLDTDADIYIKKFISNFQSGNFTKEAYQKLAWHYLIQGDTLSYFANMKLILAKGNLYTDEDMQAEEEALSQEIPNIYLLKARLLFDGGYFEKAIQVLTTVDANEAFKTTKEALEYSYRLARIYHEKGDVEKAIAFYEITIEAGSNHTSYFAANSCLQLGLIYEQKKQNDLAKTYFIKAQNQNNTVYKNSINQKAKAGLNRIK